MIDSSSAVSVTMFRPVAIVLLLLGACFAWEEFEKPLEVAKPDADGIYRFDLRLAEKLTMSTEGENGHVEVLDFEPDEINRMPWEVRNSDQNTACEAFDSFNSTKNNNLTSLLQLHGLHQVVFAVNGKVPADPIVVPLGAEVILTVHNKFLSAAVSIHVHGLDKRGLWYTDGVAFLQQCPIPPMSTHTYHFIADTPGTHWMHGHLGMDRGHGLLGAFIIKTAPKEEVQMDAKDANSKIIPPREYAMVVHDWTVASSDYIWFAQRWRTMKWQWGFDVEKLGRCWAPTRTYDFGAIGGIVAMRALLVNQKGWHDQDDVFERPEVLPLSMFRIKKAL
uniref:Plastocyanin-like domain-containing protein n=1 Tax=Panagrellus redivivus TaxID=6233 RepID=A0A7E4WDQ7_PANRE